MTGQVTPQRAAQISVLVYGPRGAEQRVTTSVDTGFTGYLTLPRATVSSLGLEYDGPVDGRLADGSRVVMRVYVGWADWHGARRKVSVVEAEGNPLLGMAMLHGSCVYLEVVDGGPVQIDPLP